MALFITLCGFSIPLLAATPSLAPPLEKQQSLSKKHARAEVLHLLDNVVLAADGHWQRTVYVSVRINDLDAARDYGRISIGFNHYYTDTVLDFANTLSPGGQQKSVLDDAVQERVTGGGQDFYSDRSELVFSLPDILPGSILEFQFSKKSKNLALEELYSTGVTPFWFQNTAGNDGWRVEYVHNHTFTLTQPKDTPLYTKSYAGYADQPKITPGDKTITRQWVMKNVPAQKSEGWFPVSEEVIPQLRISTLNNWSAIDAWSWAKVVDKLTPTQQLESVALSLDVIGTASTEEKIKAVYEYLQTKVRYVFAHLGRGGYEPHFPSETIDASYGDCKDQTVLAITLLRMLGVEAYPALVETPNAGRHDPDIVGLIFDHMIVYIANNEEGTQWLDTTGDRALFPGMSNYMAGQNALIVDGKGGHFTKIPEASLNENNASLFMRYSINKKGNTIADVDLKLSGYFEQNMRSWWTYDSNRDEQLQQLLKGLFNHQIEYDVQGEIINHGNLFEPVSVKARYEFTESHQDDMPTQAAGFNQLFSFYVDTSALPLPAKRANRFVDHYPYSLNMQVDFGGNALVPVVVQSSTDVEHDYFSLAQSGKMTEDNYQIAMNFKRDALNLSLDQYQDFYTGIQAVNKVKPWVVSLQPNAAKNDAQDVANAKQQHGSGSLEYTFALVQTHINQGEFEEALVQAQQAVNLDAKNGHAWYLLGTAQGLNALFDESTLSFEKAESLGYLP